MHKILCVEDAEEARALIEATLKGHQVYFADSIKGALKMLENESFSLALIDLQLPDGSGFEVMASLSSLAQGLPVFILTGRSDFASKVSAFSLGADDFIVKPYDPKELRLRVEAKLKKSEEKAREQEFLKVGPLTCNLQEQRLVRTSNREVVDLTSLEFRVFHLLAKVPNKIFSRSEILDRVWGYSVSVTDRAVDVHVSNLRKKLKGSGVNIEAVVGAGYRLFIEDEIAHTPLKKSF